MEWSDGRGNVSSLHFQAGDGRKLKDKSKQKSKCKHHRVGGATQLWKTKKIMPF